MTEKDTVCIYCGKPVAVRQGEGDHVVPAALGRFEGEFVFRRICPPCNNRLSGCEEQLLRCAPEAVMRRWVQPPVKRNKRGQNWVGADGMPAPAFYIDSGDHHELARCPAHDGRNLRPVDQLVIGNKGEGERHIPLDPRMTAESLRTKLEAFGVRLGDPLALHADEESYSKYVALLKEVWPDAVVEKGECREAGNHRVPTKIKCTFGEGYWRAIAKIGFHYYLVNSCRGMRGDEPEFDDVRRFIMEGGDWERFFSNPAARLDTPFGKRTDGTAVVPSVWAHVLVAVESKGAVVAIVGLFVGPARLPKWHYINLGKLSSPIVVPAERYSHGYIYDAESRRERFAGRVESISRSG